MANATAKTGQEVCYSHEKNCLLLDGITSQLRSFEKFDS